ncbi:SusC/RagA family TonB-linked outer membrane protein [Mucilaginibacter daejeonensis]|uniref:SusC/RagA family TonB-linked outer membrane protein n=1 Tax=Mucilaginibacter daejeonensis TaxID=398049 RepID=UPI001D1718C4|nr:SusC/RagA family TonB-linked outer membrane protein [Mucilaginibacter daejeonensis]UEG53485.1 SusC/RagA family TonB-linked outer membrane protein [Mucilaginibacter daejeonensis]
MKKIWLVTILVLMVLPLCVINAVAQTVLNKRITFGAEGITLKEAFGQLERSGDVSINYNNNILNDKRIVRVARAQRTVQEALNLLLTGTQLTYRQAGEKSILITATDGKRITIQGTVVDNDDSQPLIGVALMDDQRHALGMTNNNGDFNISVPANSSVTLNYIGYSPLKISYGSSQSKLTVRLMRETGQLDEVVVTALGIKREEKSLGYAASVVKNEQLTQALSNNWTDALSGKVAGLNLIRSNSGPAGSNKIILRGENNLTSGEDNEALIVVDGIVISKSSGRRSAVAGEGVYGTSSDNMPADYGSSVNDLNPEDIESVTVLKGAAAAALYGQRGANGALIITTKSGTAKKKGLGITINSNTALESVNRWPDLQYEYGQGTGGANYYSYGAGVDGASTSGTSSAYGPKFDGQMFFQLDPVTQTRSTVRTPWVPYKNQIREFFQTGSTYTNSISIDGGGDRTTARFSATNVTNKWITPNTGYNRNSLALSVNSKINDKLTIGSKVNYNNRWSDNLPGAGYGNQSLMYWFIFWQPNADLNWLKNYWRNGQQDRQIFYPYSTFPENPYAVSYEFLNKSNRNALTGNMQATYAITKALSLQVRATLDMSYEQRSQQRPYDAGTKYPKGSYRTQNIYTQEAGADFLLRYNKKLNKDFTLTATAGGSMLRNKYVKDEVRADSLVYPGLFTIANNAGPLVTLPNQARYALNSFYGVFSTSFKDYLYLDITGRNDWNSTLATPTRNGNSSFFYPSASLAFLVSEAFKMPQSIDYFKLRGSVADVGSGGNTPYVTSLNYAPAGSTFSGGLVNPTRLANPSLNFLKTTTIEVGAEMRLFKNRAGFDIALYTGNTRNQILNRVIDAASGYREAIINAGKVNNRGIEIALNGTPIRTKTFDWSLYSTFTSNRNTIKQLADSSFVIRTGPTGGGQIVAKVGGSMGDLYGRGYQRSPDGQIVYDPSTGFAKLADNVVYLGNTMPKWRTSLGSNFRYKQFNLNVLFDAQFGAVAYSLSNYKLAEQGKTSITLPGRYNGIIGKGVVRNADGSYSPNTTIASDIDGYYRSHYGIDNAEGNTFSTDFIKFREANLSYTFKPTFTKKLGIQRATIGVYGRNLFLWTNWPVFDPEFGTLAGTDIVQGFEVAQFPSTRSYGFNLTIGI